MKWQPIETAPKDGTTILLASGKYVLTGYWETDPGWAWKFDGPCWGICEVEDDYYSVYKFPDWPTHWMPLPEPPNKI